MDLLPCLSLAETRLVTAFMRWGSEESDTAGHNCVALKASLRELCANTAISKPSALTAIHTFRDWGILSINKNADSLTARRSPHEASKYQLRTQMPRHWVERVARNRGKKSLPLIRRHPPDQTSGKIILPSLNNTNGDGVDLYLDTEINSSPSPLPGTSRGKKSLPLKYSLVSGLAKIGFTKAEAFVAQHPAERIEAAIAYVDDPLTAGLSNPAGFIRHLVEAPGEIPAPPSAIKEKAKLNKYTSGKYGHLVKR